MNSRLAALTSHYALLLCVAFLILDGALLTIWLEIKNGASGATIGETLFGREYPELRELQSAGNIQDPFPFFRDLAEKKSARYAFEVLKRAPVPPGTDMHLLGHEVGDALYQQEGAKGISACTQDFRNACSHSIVVGLFQEKGEGALDEITNACRNAPGGKGAYTMCFHGLGHGILAATGYDLAKTVSICQKTGGGGEMPQCISGAVMEIIGGGFHNKGLWERQRPKYLDAKQPLLPCAGDLIPEEARPLCYSYLTPHLLESSGADLASPTPEDFEHAFPLCDKIPQEQIHNRRECFGGYGKEFVVLVKERDIRAVDEITDAQLSTIYQWCRLAKHEEGAMSCVLTALHSLYWGGENDRGASVRFCTLIADENHRATCVNDLIGAVGFFINDMLYRKSFCKELPARYTQECRKRLLTP